MYYLSFVRAFYELNQRKCNPSLTNLQLMEALRALVYYRPTIEAAWSYFSSIPYQNFFEKSVVTKISTFRKHKHKPKKINIIGYSGEVATERKLMFRVKSIRISKFGETAKNAGKFPFEIFHIYFSDFIYLCWAHTHHKTWHVTWYNILKT